MDNRCHAPAYPSTSWDRYGYCRALAPRVRMPETVVRRGGRMLSRGVSTYGLQRRFYHLVFSGHHPNGSLRFDTYANYSEWNTLTNGYLGLATASDGTTWWSLADGSWQRQLQWWKSSAEYGTLPPLSVLPFYLLYPVHASDPVQGIDKSILLLASTPHPRRIRRILSPWHMQTVRALRSAAYTCARCPYRPLTGLSG